MSYEAKRSGSGYRERDWPVDSRKGAIGEGCVERSSGVDCSASSWERRNLRVKGSRVVASDVAAKIMPPLGREEAPDRCCINHLMMARS